MPTTCSPRVTRLNADLGTTIVLAEHRLERAAPLADRAVLVGEGRAARRRLAAAPCSPSYAGAPSVTQLGRLLGWEPLPLTVRDARARGRRRPATSRARRHPPPTLRRRLRRRGQLLVEHAGSARRPSAAGTVLDASISRSHRGEVVALLGRNGSGKTTLLRTLARLTEPGEGPGRAHRATVAYVPQDPNSLLFAADRRGDEVAETLRLLGRRDHATAIG